MDIGQLKAELEKIKSEKDGLVRSMNYEAAARLRDREIGIQELVKKIIQYRNQSLGIKENQ